MKILGSSGKGNASVNAAVEWATIARTTLATVSMCLSGLSALSGARSFCCCILAWPCCIVTSLVGRQFGSAIRVKPTGTALKSLLVVFTGVLAVGLEFFGGYCGEMLAAEVFSFVCNFISLWPD